MNLIRSIYIHIPFCVKKCTYCDFTIHAIGKRDPLFSQSLKDTYIDYLKKEMGYFLRQNEKASPLKTIYIGGGTPSLLSSKNLNDMFGCIAGYRGIDSDCEITIENEPDSINLNKVKDYKSLGINRLSLGLQTLNNKHLFELNRNHTYEDFSKSVEIINHYYDVSQLNVDLLLGVPGDDINSFKTTLKAVKDMSFGHLSLYNLTVEKNTKFEKLILNNKFVLDDSFQAEAYLSASSYLESNGYNHYEVSNYCKISDTDLRSRHSMMYWEGDTDFFGFGVGASSLINGHRFKRPTTLKAYFKYVEELINGKYDVLTHGEAERSNIAQYLETIFIGATRTKEGVGLDKLKKIFEKYDKRDFFEKFIKNVKSSALFKIGKIEITESHLRVKKDGFIISDAILRELCLLISNLV